VDQHHGNVGGCARDELHDLHSHQKGFAHGGVGRAARAAARRELSRGARIAPGARRCDAVSLACADCHAPTTSRSSRMGKISAGTQVCASCHSAGGARRGNDPVIGAKNTSRPVCMRQTLMGKENWCRCHDKRLGRPGRTAPNKAGRQTAATATTSPGTAGPTVSAMCGKPRRASGNPGEPGLHWPATMRARRTFGDTASGCLYPNDQSTPSARNVMNREARRATPHAVLTPTEARTNRPPTAAYCARAAMTCMAGQQRTTYAA